MKTQEETRQKRTAKSEEEPDAFIQRLDAGEFDGHLFEEIRKLRAEHLAKVCRILAARKFEASSHQSRS